MPLPIVHFRFSAPPSGALQRTALLEQLLAYSTCGQGGADWRADAFEAIAAAGASLPAAGPAAWCGAAEADSIAPSGAWVCVATPVHVVAGMTDLTLSGDGILPLDAEDATRLVVDFNRMFSGTAKLALARGGALLCVFDHAVDVSLHDPELVIGRDVFERQPGGADAPRLRALMSEVEMWLFDHDVNRRRAARSLPTITGLWLWGGGATLQSLPTVTGWTAGQDPLFAAYGNARDYPVGAHAGVVVAASPAGSAGWPEVERRWLAPAAAALRAGTIERLDLSVAARRFQVRRRGHWRFWRRPRPWWETVNLQGDGSHEP